MKFQDIIELKRWQKIQDIAAAILSTSLRTIDFNCEVVTNPSRESELWQKILVPAKRAQSEYRKWLAKRLQEFKALDPEQCYQTYCPLGLSWFFVPLQSARTETAYLCLGPVIIEHSHREGHISQRVQEFGLDEDAFFDAYNKLPCVNATSMNSMLDFLHAISSFVLKIYNDEFHGGAHGAPLNKAGIGMLLRMLLDMAMKLCNAEFGSVMTFEQQSQLLSIQDAHGLSEDVVKDTKIKPGEGLAGLTIQQRKSLFVNDQLKDREVRLRMHRPKIKSAFVIPVFHQQEILGVISVGTAKSPNRFSDNLMELLNELVGIALDRVAFENKDS